jgi:predicted nucleic acid-binding protein
VRIIVDTNVVMSGVFFGGAPGRILDAWAQGRLELVLSPDILQEYRRVGAELAARYPERSGALAPALTLIAMNAILVDADVPVIISGDRDLLDVSGWRNVLVLSPRQFADRHLLDG